jgi:hypothetical protein
VNTELFKSIKAELFDYCCGDWLDFGTALRLVAMALHAPNDEAAIEETITVVRQLLEEGLFVVGELPAKGKKNFELWGGDINELTKKIAEECQRIKAQDRPNFSCDVCWFALTPKGEQIANDAR